MNVHANNTIPTEVGDVERPSPSSGKSLWASDAIAQTLRSLDIPYAAMNPGASYRGLHDSIVNYLGNHDPQMLLCLHEEHAVHIAQGWAKVTETPMMAILHSNVGLMHATMAIFNAWCDRVPMVLVGATGPVDASLRRPWVDWIHTSKDQGALIRGYTKWDDQPSSVAAASESLLRARAITATYPHGPTYVCIDAGLQEMPINEMPPQPESLRFKAPAPAAPSPDLVRQAAEALSKARRPLILAGRVSRSEADWDRRIALAERLGAIVLTDLRVAAAFPTTHRLHPSSAGFYATEQSNALMREADVVLSLDWLDVGGTLKTALRDTTAHPQLIHASMDHVLHNGWSMDYQTLPPVDIHFANKSDTVVSALLAALDTFASGPESDWGSVAEALPADLDLAATDKITVGDLAAALRTVTSGKDICLVRIPNAWSGRFWNIEHPLDFLGLDGGGGLASGPGIAVGAGLALKRSGRLPVSIVGDGDYLMGATALWTAARYGIPTLVIVANNRSFYNDEVHQEAVARTRGRLVDNKWIGQHISGPDVDLAAIARAQGAVGFGPVEQREALEAVLAEAVELVEKGNAVVVDVVVGPGYENNTTRSLVRKLV